jgi:hypothetical protein
MAIRARYKGQPHPQRPTEPLEYLDGIPARDLSDDEYEALSIDDKKRVRDSSLYEVAPANRGDG